MEIELKQNGDSRRFDYTGTIQDFEISVNGLYKLDVLGAQGGNGYTVIGNTLGGNGGYSTRYVYLEANTTLYIVIGGCPVTSETCDQIPDPEGGWTYGNHINEGGFNGGGDGVTSISGGDGWHDACGGGGGATHIATRSGLLENLESYKSSILVVAGGGGGAHAWTGAWNEGDEHGEEKMWHGGCGGGLEGELPSKGSIYTPDYTFPEATQSSGFQFGRGHSCDGHDGLAGGGGGWYGGYFSAGGSGYIGHDAEITYKGKKYISSTSSGYNSGNGAAIITLIQRSAPTVYLGTKEISAICFVTHEISDIKINNQNLEVI